MKAGLSPMLARMRSVAGQNAPHCVPSDSVSHSITDSTCPLCLNLVWLLVKVHQYIYFGCMQRDRQNMGRKEI